MSVRNGIVFLPAPARGSLAKAEPFRKESLVALPTGDGVHRLLRIFQMHFFTLQDLSAAGTLEKVTISPDLQKRRSET
jgi:hypothetical protein